MIRLMRMFLAAIPFWIQAIGGADVATNSFHPFTPLLTAEFGQGQRQMATWRVKRAAKKLGCG